MAVQTELRNSELELQCLLNTRERIVLPPGELKVNAQLDSIVTDRNPEVLRARQQISLANARVAVERSKLLPEFMVGYSQQLVIKSFNPASLKRDYTSGTRIAGIQAGLAIPIFGGAGKARVKSEQIASQLAENDLRNTEAQAKLGYEQEMERYTQLRQVIDFYSESGLKLADEQLRIAEVSFRLGEIGYIEYLQNSSQAVQNKLTYLDTLDQSNRSAIQLQYLKGN